MGNFYTNYTLRGPSQSAVAAALVGRSAIVTPEHDGSIIVFDEESDDQNQEVIAELAARLSRRFACPLLAVMNHDDSIFWYQLYLNGELVDEYDSSPAYFDSSADETASNPAGGDAQTLCEAFGAGNIAEVETVLRKPSGDEDGYVFAIERHADLAGYLGISSFGVGAGFNHICAGELPDELNEEDLVGTKDLAIDPGHRRLDADQPEPIPGYYKVSFRAHPELKQSIPTGWMPGLWTELECSAQDLSEGFRRATAVASEKMKLLGFTDQGCKKLKRVLNPNSRDRGGINYLDRTRCHFGQLIYNRFYYPPLETEKESVIVSFTAVFDKDILSCTNNTQKVLDTLPNHQVVRLKSEDAAFVYQHFLELLKQRQDLPRHFPDMPSLKSWFDANAIEIFDDKVRRRIWVRMSDYEVEVARRKLPDTI